MSGYWLFICYSIFIPAFLLLSLLLLPLPRYIRKYTLRLVNRVLFTRIFVGGGVVSVPLVYVVLVFVGVVFLWTLKVTRGAEAEWAVGTKLGHRDTGVLLNKFRDERNLWIAGFGLTLWVILWRIQALLTIYLEEISAPSPTPAALPTQGSPVSKGSAPAPAASKPSQGATAAPAVQAVKPSAPPDNIESSESNQDTAPSSSKDVSGKSSDGLRKRAQK